MVSGRRSFLRQSATGLVAGALLGSGCTPARRPPNVLFLSIDDLNAYVGCLGGHPQTRTPNIDRLAREGVLFANAHCTAPVCSPSRISLFTGLRPTTTGIYRNLQPLRSARPDAVTLTEHLRSQGYRVLGGGKLFHGGLDDPQSWDETFPGPLNPLPEGRPLNGLNLFKTFDWGPVDVPDEAMSDWQVAEWGIQQLDKRHDKPFFLGVGFFRPHLPLYVPPKYFEPFQGPITLPEVRLDDLNDVPEAGRALAEAAQWFEPVQKSGQWEDAVRAYLACVHFVDAQVGRVLDALTRSEYAQNTIVALWSDNGWHLGEKLHWHKQTLWRESTQAPLIVRAPGVTAPGGRCEEAVSLLDVYPTVLDLCGLPLRTELEGESLLPQLQEPNTPRSAPAICTANRGNHAVITRDRRYIRYADGSDELYDIQADPHEWRNLARAPERTEEKERLAAWIPKTEAPDAPSVEKTWAPR